jgi:hypothetical protein
MLSIVWMTLDEPKADTAVKALRDAGIETVKETTPYIGGDFNHAIKVPVGRYNEAAEIIAAAVPGLMVVD